MPYTRSKEIVFRIAQLFFEGHKVTQIRDAVNKEFKLEPGLSREAIYPLLTKAVTYGFVKLVPGLHEKLAEEITDRFRCQPGSIVVVPTQDQKYNYLVAEVAAGLVLNFLRNLKKGGQDEVGLGLGPGRATLDFSVHLGDLLSSEIGLPKINLHAISAGCPTDMPEYASTSFFNLFPRNLVSKRFGLFAETTVPTKDYTEITHRPWIWDAFEQRNGISIIATSMGYMHDDHDLFTEFLKKSGCDMKKLQKQGWVGNVQYRPYKSNGRVPPDQEPVRAVTLFELEDFVSIAKTKNKHVVLIARQCAKCGQSRAKALKPLLEIPELRVWSEIVMDVATAAELMEG